MENPNNRIVAAGQLEDSLTLSHEVMNEPFYAGTLLVKRLSGAVDRLPVTIPGKLMDLNEIGGIAVPNANLNRDGRQSERDSGEESNLTGQLLLVTGQVRSYNKVVEGSGRLMVTLFVQSMTPTVENDTMNKVNLEGVLCKPPISRPKGGAR